MARTLGAEQALRPVSPSPSSRSTAALLPNSQISNNTQENGAVNSVSRDRALVPSLRRSTTAPLRSSPPSSQGPSTTSTIPARVGQTTIPMRQGSRLDHSWKEWRSWKIQFPWLMGQLCILLGVIITLISLDQISKNNYGFVALGDPPWFFASNPGVDEAIWQQGLFYTALPAFLMTLYAAIWNSIVSHMAERQPYVELGKEKGRPAAQTLLLDYRADSSLLAWITAFRNGHLFLGACMLSSAVLTVFVIPLVSFVFTPNSFTFERQFPLNFDTSYNRMRLMPSTDMMDLRSALEFAAATKLRNAPQYPWTHDIYALPQFTPNTDVNDGSLIVNTTALYSDLDCVVLTENEYRKTIIHTTESSSVITNIEVEAWDRGCASSNNIALQASDYPPARLSVSSTVTCPYDAGLSRFNILTAYREPGQTNISDFNVISCIPRYWLTSGIMNSTTSQGSSSPVISSFDTDTTNAAYYKLYVPWLYFEMYMQLIGCFDPGERLVDASNDFGRYLYHVSSFNGPKAPLNPAQIIQATEQLHSMSFAIWAASSLYTKDPKPTNSTGTFFEDVTRLVVVTPVAYMILVPLFAVAILNVAVFFYVRERSILSEEAIGILSIAGLVRRSTDLQDEVTVLMHEARFDGKVRKHALSSRNFLKTMWYYNYHEKKICKKSTTTPDN